MPLLLQPASPEIVPAAGCVAATCQAQNDQRRGGIERRDVTIGEQIASSFTQSHGIVVQACNPDVAIAHRRRVNAVMALSGLQAESVIADGQNAQP